jgi:hypothetical protein
MDRIIHAHRKLQYNLYNLLARTATLSQMPGTYCDFCGVRFHKTVSEPIWTNLNQHGALESFELTAVAVR